VLLDAGPFWDPDRDWVSDERGSHGLYWTDPRQIGGADPVPLGSNNSGRGVGGSMVHYAGYTPRFHPSDFHTHTTDGVGVDWPIDYADLRPYYEQIEAELPVAGQDWPWGDPHRYPHSPHPVSGNGLVALRGAHAMGVDMRVGPVAIPNGRFGNRPHCIYRGFCIQGCKVNAKASPLITHIPDALAHGAEVRPDCHVSRVLVDDDTGRATGVVYVHDGVLHRQLAQSVVIAGYSIETPRLLLLSASERYPDGLGNDHDHVGRHLMVQGAPQVAGRFADEIRMYKAPPPEVSSEQFYETDPSKPYRRGFSIQTVSPLPITWSEHVAAQGHWGQTLREYMRDYVHWATLGALCELLPLPDNRVTLSDETDRHGLPVAHFAYTQCDNDKRLIDAATTVMSDLLRAAGAEEVIAIQRYAHLVGGARMATRPQDGVIDAEHRVFGVDRLYVVDGSVMPTQGAANPALTIMALAVRAADLMKRHAVQS
jgi:choline dehydrogenase-like flavoprotein